MQIWCHRRVIVSLFSTRLRRSRRRALFAFRLIAFSTSNALFFAFALFVVSLRLIVASHKMCANTIFSSRHEKRNGDDDTKPEEEKIVYDETKRSAGERNETKRNKLRSRKLVLLWSRRCVSITLHVLFLSFFFLLSFLLLPWNYI